MRTCAFNNDEGTLNASTAQASCRSLDFFNNTMGYTLPELWNAGVYWDDEFINVLSYDAALDIVPAARKSGDDHDSEQQGSDGQDELGVVGQDHADGALYDSYLSKMMGDESADDAGAREQASQTTAKPSTNRRRRRTKKGAERKQDTTTTTDTGATADYSTAGTTLYDCGLNHQPCEHRPYSFCDVDELLLTEPECKCFDGFGDYADGCSEYTTHSFCGDADAETCALVLWLLDQPGCVVEEDDDIDYDCAAQGYTVKECFESGLPLRYRDFQQFVPPSTNLNPSTWQYLRSLGFTDATQGWVMSFVNAGVVASDELKCRCEDQGMRCRCSAELQNFTCQEAFVNGTVEVVDTSFRTYTEGLANGLEDNIEGAT